MYPVNSVNVAAPPSCVGIPEVGPDGQPGHHILLIAVTTGLPPTVAVLFAANALKLL
jgi:hypothetical protein